MSPDADRGTQRRSGAVGWQRHPRSPGGEVCVYVCVCAFWYFLFFFSLFLTVKYQLFRFFLLLLLCRVPVPGMETHVPVLFLDLSGTLFAAKTRFLSGGSRSLTPRLLVQLTTSSLAPPPLWPEASIHYSVRKRRRNSLTFTSLNTRTQR